jgi:hypothetical protein
MMGPFEVMRTAIARMPKNGDIRINAGMTQQRSNVRFQGEVHQELKRSFGKSWNTDEDKLIEKRTGLFVRKLR